MNESQISEIIALAWDDEAAFDAIERQFGLSEGDVIKLMRLNMKPSSFQMWRKRVSGRKTKHEAYFDKMSSKEHDIGLARRTPGSTAFRRIQNKR